MALYGLAETPSIRLPNRDRNGDILRKVTVGHAWTFQYFRVIFHHETAGTAGPESPVSLRQYFYHAALSTTPYFTARHQRI